MTGSDCGLSAREHGQDDRDRQHHEQPKPRIAFECRRHRCVSKWKLVFDVTLNLGTGYKLTNDEFWLMISIASI